MLCSRCQHDDSKVTDSRSHGTSIRRRRECLHCGFRFTTWERVEQKLPLVIKRDGSREPFERSKIRDGLHYACRKSQVTAARMESAAEQIEQEVLLKTTDEILSDDIGKLVLHKLQELDMGSYLRFASIYLSVETPEDFLKLLEPWIASEDSIGA